jgi:pyrroline-5-carboxylate reductase
MDFSSDGPVVLAGAGKMGGAMLAGWMERGLAADRIIVQDPGPPPEIAELLVRAGIRRVAEIESLPRSPAVIVAAVKPQVMDEVFPRVARLAGPGTLTITIAAGKSIASFARHLPQGAAVVRAMPNTPAAIGRGVTVCCANPHTRAAQREDCERLLSAVGSVHWIDDEALMDAVTAVSGSGPAYVFALVEALAEAGVAAGLPRELANQLARETVSGSGELLARSPLAAEELRRNVTSPGGTTAAALAVLLAEQGLGALMREAVAAATKRGRELAK